MPGDPGAPAQKHAAQGPSIAIDQKTDHTTVEVIAQEYRPPLLHAIQTAVQVESVTQTSYMLMSQKPSEYLLQQAT